MKGMVMSHWNLFRFYCGEGLITKLLWVLLSDFDSKSGHETNEPSSKCGLQESLQFPNWDLCLEENHSGALSRVSTATPHSVEDTLAWSLLCQNITRRIWEQSIATGRPSLPPDLPWVQLPWNWLPWKHLPVTPVTPVLDASSLPLILELGVCKHSGPFKKNVLIRPLSVIRPLRTWEWYFLGSHYRYSWECSWCLRPWGFI